MSDEINEAEDEKTKADPSAELSEPALDEVVGGTAPATDAAAASGLPTGKRMHKPI
jgi:hypothetical protein